jgi:membrane-bound serine protease (ClpP class)
MAALVLVHLAALVLGAQPAAAGGVDDPGFVSVVKVSGLIDRVLADFVEGAVTDAEDGGAVAIVLQVNSSGAVVSDATMDHLTDHLTRAKIPVTVWVGPSGSQALAGATRLLAAADIVGVAPGSRIEVTRELLDAKQGTGVAVGDRLGAKAAVKSGLADSDAPVLVDFVGDLDGVRSRVIQTDSGPRRQPTTQVKFAQLPLTAQLMHTVASPAVAYLLFVIGLALIVFELFTAGIGVAGVVGAGSLVLGSYGLAALPTSPVAVALILVAMFGYSVDVQTGVPRFWSGLATVLFVVGSLLLFDGVSVSWITLVVAIVGMTLAMIGGMPAMVRSRFSTPTIGREWIVGEVGTARGAVAPDGIVTVRDAPWRARTNRATPIAAGQVVKVVSIDGLVLEVEPEDGGARDHRERRADRA